MNSCRKGKVGERELARMLTAHGFPARRDGQQGSGGGQENPDVLAWNLPTIHWECKRVERFALYDSLAQARRDAADWQTPVVAHRKSYSRWVAVLDLADFLAIVRDSELMTDGAPTTED